MSSLSYSCLGEALRGQGSRWQDQTRVHSYLLFLYQQSGTTSKEFWAPLTTGRSTVHADENLQIHMVIVRKLFGGKKTWVIWPKLAFKRPTASFFPEFWQTDKIFEISVSNCVGKTRQPGSYLVQVTQLIEISMSSRASCSAGRCRPDLAPGPSDFVRCHGRGLDSYLE